MKILWVTPFLPHANAGHAGGRALHQWLGRLAERNEVTLLTRLEPQERPHLAALPLTLRAVHILEFARPRPGPLQAAHIIGSYLRLGRLANRLLSAGDWDVVHVEWIEAGLALRRRRTAPGVVVAHDELTKPARRWLEHAAGPAARTTAWLRWRAACAIERWICRKFEHVLAMSDVDRRTLAKIDPRLSVSVLPFPIGIDPARLDGATRERDHLLFVGAMNRDVNVDAVTFFCREVLPLVRSEVPAARLTIVGQGPPDAVRQLAAIPGVAVTGFVPVLEPYYARATVFVAPLRIGGGIISKLLDAMAAGCPVVATTVANEGVEASPDRDLLVADGAEAFARAVGTALRDDALCARLAAHGRAFVRERYSLDTSVEALERAHAALTRR